MLQDVNFFQKFPQTPAAHIYEAAYDARRGLWLMPLPAGRTPGRLLVTADDFTVCEAGPETLAQAQARPKPQPYPAGIRPETAPPPETSGWLRSRDLRALMPVALKFAAFTARHLLVFRETMARCPACGDLRAQGPVGEMRCAACGRTEFPAISPAVILGIVDRRRNRLLVTRYADRPFTGPALVAGYCEIGETAETTCAREAMEETSLNIGTPTYFASQPWGLSGTLLLGYYADVEAPETLHLADGELKLAEWLTPEECERLRPAEGTVSLTATMIAHFARSNGNV